MLSRRSFLAGMLAGAPSRVNILLITADNLGYGDLGCYGNTEIKTPHFDAFAPPGRALHELLHGMPDVHGIAGRAADGALSATVWVEPAVARG
jgi:arylsulfatase A-like enzyme